MTHNGKQEITSESDISMIRSATSYRATTSDDSFTHNSGIVDSRSCDMAEEFFDSPLSSIQSDLVTSPITISGRGALISGMAVPSIDSDDEIVYEGEDIESGPEPPDSDYATNAPPKAFQKSILRMNDKNSSTIASESNMKRHSITESSDVIERTNMSYYSAVTEKPRRSKRFCCILMLISLVFIAAIIAIALTVPGDRSLSPQQLQVRDIAISISGQEAIDEKFSPQKKAFDWIVNDDKLFRNTKEVLNRDAVVQRYVLAVFYYATNGPLWNNHNWMKDSECGVWTGVTCNNENQLVSLYLGT
jgi:hypothetical protein